MKKLQKMMISFCAVLIVFVGQLSAQSTRGGIGINVVDFFANFSVLYLLEEDIDEIVAYPVLYGSVLTAKIRIDPEFSYWRYSHTVDHGVNNYKSIERTTIAHFGLGISPLFKKSSKNLFYAGAKLGIDVFSSKSEEDYLVEKQETKRKSTNFYIGPCFGTEHFFTGDLSLGGEFQLLYTSIGQEKVTYNGKESDDVPDISESLIRSKALVYLRWYF